MNVVGSIRENLRCARFNLGEVSGSLGDLGTFLPLLVGMSMLNGFSFASALFFAGLFNVITGLAFSVPMAVQPMKAIAAVAITEGLTPGEIAGAGAIVGIVVLTLGMVGLIDTLVRVIPRPVVRGLQLALGLRLAMKGVGMVVDTDLMLGIDSYATGTLAVVFVVVATRLRRVPTALILFLVGAGLTLWASPGVLDSLTVGITIPTVILPTSAELGSSFLKAAVPQIPLTLLNSVIAVSALAHDLFPDRSTSPKKIAISVGVMNLASVWFGAMPMCHGAGGLAGQYRFGARTNGSVLFLGAIKIFLAVAFGASLISICGAFPASILGVMLAFAGVELALVCRDQRTRAEAAGVFITAGAILGTGQMALGLVIGLALVALIRKFGSDGRDARPTDLSNNS